MRRQDISEIRLLLRLILLRGRLFTLQATVVAPLGPLVGRAMFGRRLSILPGLGFLPRKHLLALQDEPAPLAELFDRRSDQWLIPRPCEIVAGGERLPVYRLRRASLP